MARPELFKHRKLRRLCGLMRLQTPYAVGILETMWNTVYETGDPYLGTAWEVKVACMYEGDEGELVSALCEAGFIDDLGDGEYQVHDLHENAPRYVKDRWRKRDARRGQSADKVRTAARTRPQNVHASPPLPSPPHTEEQSMPVSSETSALPKGRINYPADYNALWRMYPDRGDKKDGYKQWLKMTTEERTMCLERTPAWVEAYHDPEKPNFTPHIERYLSKARYMNATPEKKRTGRPVVETRD